MARTRAAPPRAVVHPPQPEQHDLSSSGLLPWWLENLFRSVEWRTRHDCHRYWHSRTGRGWPTEERLAAAAAAPAHDRPRADAHRRSGRHCLGPQCNRIPRIHHQMPQVQEPQCPAPPPAPTRRNRHGHVPDSPSPIASTGSATFGRAGPPFSATAESAWWGAPVSRPIRILPIAPRAFVLQTAHSARVIAAAHATSPPALSHTVFVVGCATTKPISIHSPLLLRKSRKAGFEKNLSMLV